MTDTSAEPRWRRLPEERPRQIIDAAFAEFAERGLAASRLEDIARRAGLSKGTIYLYFANKEELFREVVRGTVISALERGEAATEGKQDPRAALSAWMEGFWEFLRSPVFPAMHRLVTSELHSFPDLAAFYATEVIERKQRLVSGMIERGMHAGLYRRTDPLVAARMLSALFVTHAIWFHQRTHFTTIRAIPEQELLRQITDFFFAAMRPEAPGALPHASS